MMALCLIYLAIGICILAIPSTRAGLLGRDINVDQDSMPGEDMNINQDDQEAKINERLLSRLLEKERQNLAAPEAGDTPDIKAAPEEDGEVRETIEKFDGDRSKVDISVGNELIEQHLRDCDKRYEIIVMSEDDANERKRSCYLHKMDDKLYNFVCLGIGEKPHQTYNIGVELEDKTFLSEDGPDRVCRYIPMFLISTADDIDVYKDESPLEREIKESDETKSKICRKKCLTDCKTWKCNKSCRIEC
ncbi:hypothetical protein CHS0354_024319 [Potamilus streckersoni]|uniref:Uncharacterized protein n=1 Tax=Potamilus streckersoni TaxID=2493646 RepID=A0AAE0VHA9_9BIVA|nr:hypothetical protein CHS0354_024319 [Potamilus streckersoni]